MVGSGHGSSASAWEKFCLKVWGLTLPSPPLSSFHFSPHRLRSRSPLLLPSPCPSAPSFLPTLPLDVDPLNPGRGPGERFKLPQRCLGRSPSRNRIWCILALKCNIWMATTDQGLGKVYPAKSTHLFEMQRHKPLRQSNRSLTCQRLNVPTRIRYSYSQRAWWGKCMPGHCDRQRQVENVVLKTVNWTQTRPLWHRPWDVVVVCRTTWNATHGYAVPTLATTTPWVKKTRHQTLSHIFINYYPIFKIFSLKTL